MSFIQKNEIQITDDRMWRKTRSTLENTTCKGVDVNRNFDFHWGQTGASLNPCQSDYAGPKPFSEPEARALRNYVLSDAKRILLYVSLHSYGKFLMYPWSYTKQKTSDWRIMKTLAEKANKAIIDEGGEPYFIGTAPQLLCMST
uniref:Peptidase M14 domain-containing protein n=1 Tax=Timema monikensis TaxID=170555 RepID=A0A7R9E1T0_9NEOP|nr:unnamed protein product [Timema monikensis]